MLQLLVVVAMPGILVSTAQLLNVESVQFVVEVLWSFVACLQCC